MDKNKDGQIADYMEQMISITAEVFHVKRSDVIRAMRERLNSHVNADGIKRLLGLKNLWMKKYPRTLGKRSRDDLNGFLSYIICKGGEGERTFPCRHPLRQANYWMI